MEEIKSREGGDGAVQVQEVMGALAAYTPNQKLKVNHGPFEGKDATYCNHSENRVLVLIALLGRKIKVKLKHTDVSAKNT